MAMMASSGPPELAVSRYGLTQVYAPIGGGKVDVVFVHGLNGSPGHTWTSEKSKIFWPAQLLPPILEEEKARILVYGYDADVVSFTDGASRDRIHNHAEHLIAELAANRRIRKATERPIVFVAHSLGGLVVKRALIYSSEIRGNYTEHLRSIFVSTYGILFLGTPHTGSDVAAWGSRLQWICDAMIPSKVIDTENQLVDALKRNNEVLQNIDRQFIQLTSRLHIYFFHEGKKTNLKGTLQYIVDEESASPNIQDVERAVIQQDHSHMCKFENDSAPGFDLVAEGIQRYAGEAPEKISLRWQSERAEQMAKKRAEVEELLPGSLKASPNAAQTGSVSSASNTPDTSQILQPVPTRPEMHDGSSNTAISTTSTKPSEPYFIVPPGFRPNTFFVGMDKEYQELSRRLFDKRRRDGTAAVLLHGQPGGGKSHLARQYVNKNKGKFSGGIFWISSTSREERWHAFWNIKQKVVARDSPGLCEGVNGNDFVQLVKTWFETRHEWLIVFDGVSIDRDEDATEMMNFIPDSKNSSIIYVSRQKNLESKQRLLRPFPIKVGALKEDDAKKLLFKELHIKKPTEAEKKKATELIKKTGGLPLAIDAISRRLADTHEPLTKYKLSTSVDPTLEGTYTQIFDDLLNLQHFEAWNLINVLCWFAGNIPVEMIHLGLKALRADKVEVKSLEDGGPPDINTTFGILMRYALIERNEPDSDRDSISSSRDSLVDPEPIDMLKIHGVVQSFCCDSLNTKRVLPQWLGYAVRLFSHSYRQADIKIKQKSEPGRVSDYRYYLVHGQRLWDHSITYETKTQPLQSIRNILHPVIDMINAEIRAREPGSSQESLKHGIFQISIFDRTSSSSDSGPSLPGPPTPNHRPTPPRLDSESVFGVPLDKEQTDSPRSFSTASPGLRPKILDHSPTSRPLEYDDVGYDSDREGIAMSHHMRPSPSELTERPPNRSRAPTTESHVGGWQIVPPARRPRKRHMRRDLGSFRPTPAKVHVDTRNADIQASNSGKKLHRRESSPAFKSLEKVHGKDKTPSPLQERIAGFFQRTLSRELKPTWAGIASGKIAPPAIPKPWAENPSSNDQALSYPIAPPLQRERTEEILRDRPANVQASSSPLASEFLPSKEYSGSPSDDRNGPQYIYYHNDSQAAYPPSGFQYTTPYPESSTSLSRLSQYSAEARPIPPRYNNGPYYTTTVPPPLGPNAAPLPFDETTIITTTRRHPSTSQSRSSPSYPISPFSPPPPPLIPAGYSSQPMSRDQSHQSTHSNAATEPVTYTPDFSPRIGPTAVLPVTDPLRPLPVFAPQQRQQYPYPFPPPSADENQREGRSLRSSAPSNLSSSLPNPLSGAAGTNRDPSPLQRATHLSTPTSEPMSRDSSSGRGGGGGGPPGIQLGEGLGVVSFENSPTMPSPSPGQTGDQVQFGAHAPISIAEAQRRVRERERELAAAAAARGSEGGRSRSRGREREHPYPDVNLIPTRSDGGMLERMVDGEVRARGEDVGLGLDLGERR